MRRLLALFALAICGCASRDTIYAPPLLGDPVGSIIVIEDKERGVLIYKMVQGTGKATMQVLVQDGSSWKLPEK